MFVFNILKDLPQNVHSYNYKSNEIRYYISDKNLNSFHTLPIQTLPIQTLPSLDKERDKDR